MSNEIDELIRKRREDEWMFCTAIHAWGGAYEQQTLGWLEGGIFVDPNLAKYWESFKQYGDPVRALSDAGISYLDMTERLTTVSAIGIDPTSYANQIKKGNYRTKVWKGLSDAVKMWALGDEIGLSKMIHDLDMGSPQQNIRVPTFDDIGDEFMAIVKSPTGKAIKSGIADLDHHLGAFFPDELTVFAARPGMGKTALALQIVRNVAAQKKKALFISIEMSEVQLYARMACGMAGQDWKNVREGGLGTKEITALDTVDHKLRSIYSGYLIIVDGVRRLDEIRDVVASVNPDIVIIDHLGEIVREPINSKDIEWYPYATKYIRQYVVRNQHVPTILIHQMNRNADARTDERKRPELSDLRGSGEIEQIADIVLMAYREDYYNPKLSHLTVVPYELSVKKHRQGMMAGTIMLSYDLQKQWFDDVKQVSPMAP